jgi:hypothetical protein
MTISRLALLVPLVLTTTALAASSGTVVPVPAFTSIELHGGGHAVLRHGAVQRVVILKGSTEYSEITVQNGSLNISPCKSWFSCPSHYDLEVEITTPSIPALNVHGGGELEAAGGFPRQNNLAVAVHGGGDVDIRSVAVDNVTATVNGGGELSVRAEKTLNATVHGGGELTYWGNPQVTSSIHGGGEVSSGS